VPHRFAVAQRLAPHDHARLMETTIRPAIAADVPALGRMAARLVRMHHALDPERFLIVEPVEEGYGRWLGREARREGALVLVAEQAGEVVGYAYATMEGRDWMALRDACGALQDIWVEERARRGGVARALLEAIDEGLRERGAPRVVLSTAARNEGAHAFFESMGFRRTMIEMTRELG
jgi:ribosomal protein S18 acetylase RimI-like enzyme